MKTKDNLSKILKILEILKIPKKGCGKNDELIFFNKDLIFTFNEEMLKFKKNDVFEELQGNLEINKLITSLNVFKDLDEINYDIKENILVLNSKDSCIELIVDEYLPYEYVDFFVKRTSQISYNSFESSSFVEILNFYSDSLFLKEYKRVFLFKNYLLLSSHKFFVLLENNFYDFKEFFSIDVNTVKNISMINPDDFFSDDKFLYFKNNENQIYLCLNKIIDKNLVEKALNIIDSFKEKESLIYLEYTKELKKALLNVENFYKLEDNDKEDYDLKIKINKELSELSVIFKNASLVFNQKINCNFESKNNFNIGLPVGLFSILKDYEFEMKFYPMNERTLYGYIDLRDKNLKIVFVSKIYDNNEL